MAIFKLSNLIKTGYDYNGYKLLALSFRLNPNTVSNKTVLNINGVKESDIPTIASNLNYYEVINDNLSNLNLNQILPNITSIAPYNIFKIINGNYIFYVLLASVNNSGLVIFSTLGQYGGIRSSGSNVDIDINIENINDSSLPKLENVKLFGLNVNTFCNNYNSVTDIGIINPNYL